MVEAVPDNNNNDAKQEVAAQEATTIADTQVAQEVVAPVETEDNPYKFYDSIGRPKYIVAPMVDQSELPYRMLTRRYGAQLCYTPMFHARLFSTDIKYRRMMFKPCPEDRPLTVQFCANDPDILLAAAKFVENDCDAVDINLGCPQGIAKKGNYGSFLLEKKDLIVSMVRKLKAELAVPVTCKIRCLPTEAQTLDLALAIQEAGASLLTVHGRCKEHNKHRVGSANYDMIKKIKQTLRIPVIANGGMGSFQDTQRALELTGCDGVMSSEGILEYPAMFDNGNIHDMDELMMEYIDLYEKYPGEADLKCLRSHMFKFLHTGLQKHTDIRDVLNKAKGFEPIKEVAVMMKERRKDETKEEKIGWYYRHWKGMGLDRETTKTFSVEPWNEQCIKDPLLNKALQPPKQKRQKTNQNSTGQQNLAAPEEKKTEEQGVSSAAIAQNTEEQKVEEAENTESAKPNSANADQTMLEDGKTEEAKPATVEEKQVKEGGASEAQENQQ